MAATEPSAAKRAMRATWLRLPRTAWTYKVAKVLTRSLLMPESAPLVLDVRFAGSFPLRIDLGDIVGNDLYCMDDHYEAPTLALWRTLAAGAATILDLGSHVGLYACVAAAANPRARVVAVEAFERNVRLLAHNAARFPNLTAVAAAIAPATGSGRFRLSPITGGGYVEDDGPHASTPGIRDRTGDAFAVETIDLATLCARHAIEAIDLMKMDLEGLEEPLLAGQDDFWARARPRHVLAEISVSRARGARLRLFDEMARRGYRSRRVEGLYTIPWRQREDLANWHFWQAP